MDSENGNKLDPQQQLKTQRALGALIQGDQAGLQTVAVNLAWLVKHPGADMLCSTQQLQRRADYFGTLDEGQQADWGAKAGEYILFVLGRLALIPEIQQLAEPKRIISLPSKLPPGMPRLPGSGGE